MTRRREEGNTAIDDTSWTKLRDNVVYKVINFRVFHDAGLLCFVLSLHNAKVSLPA
jgi:hypothetical protein